LNKFAIAAVIAAVSAVAVPASAAQLVRVKLADKSTTQIATEIRAAAEAVCTDRKAVVSAECVTVTVNDANRQLAGILKARAGQPVARREALTVVRVSLKGKSVEQINADIKLAAESVCRAANTSGSRADFRACVGGTVRSAKAQLQAMIVASRQDA
jgi:enamine deaminase RidA (YjgF/YER057c/UK114 family)